MDYEKEIPFGAFDSELMHQEITIPKGFEATIDGNKIILKKIESEDEKIRREIMEYITLYKDSLDDDEYKSWIAWLEKQGEKKSSDEVLKIRQELYQSGYNDGYKHGCEDTKKQGEQKPTDEDMKEALRTEYEKGRADAFAQMQKKWSEEDYAMIEAAINLAHEYGRHGLWVWLKSLKDRVQLQNWTKEDKERYISCLQRLSTGNPEQPETINSKWFKDHVYPQNTWKPSDEQLYILHWLATNILTNGEVEKKASEILNTLYDDLKKLKGE